MKKKAYYPIRKKLTESEACQLVEKCLERVANTLAYIRCKLDKRPDMPLSLFDYNDVEEANLLCNINYYGAYLKGVKTAINALKDQCLLDIPNPKGWLKDKDEKIYNKAIIDLIMSDSINMDIFLAHDYDDIRFTDHERDKKGKLVKCRAYFAKSGVVDRLIKNRIDSLYVNTLYEDEKHPWYKKNIQSL